MTKQVRFIRESHECPVIEKILNLEIEEDVVVDIDQSDVCRIPYSEGGDDISCLKNRIANFVKIVKEEKDRKSQVWFITCSCAFDYKINLLLKNFGRKISFHFLTTGKEFDDNITDFIESDRKIKALFEPLGGCNCGNDLPEKILQRMILKSKR